MCAGKSNEPAVGKLKLSTRNGYLLAIELGQITSVQALDSGISRLLLHNCEFGQVVN